jgi:hypothetical protein
MTTNGSDDARVWLRSPLCDANGACVEVARLNGGIGVRDSKDPDDRWLWFSRDEWTTFVAGVRSGHFDVLG